MARGSSKTSKTSDGGSVSATALADADDLALRLLDVGRASRGLFAANNTQPLNIGDDLNRKRLELKLYTEYAAYKDLSDEQLNVRHLPARAPRAAASDADQPAKKKRKQEVGAGKVTVDDADDAAEADADFERLLPDAKKNVDAATSSAAGGASSSSTALIVSKSAAHDKSTRNTGAVALFERVEQEKPEWHAPWKCYRVVSGHTGWVRCVTVDPSNEFFCTAGDDRTICVWDLASGQRKVTLTGHIAAVRGLAMSPTRPYLFSVAEDKKVKCWDLTTNTVIRDYFGHNTGVYCVAVHPTLDVLFTGARDSTIRVWDLRSRQMIHLLSGHRGAIMSVVAQSAEPQVISGSVDHVVRLWDLAAGKTVAQLTHHKKAVRALTLHPTEYTFASASVGSIKKWKCPEGRLLLNYYGHEGIINSLAVNSDGVMAAGGDDGTLSMFDWRTGYRFQQEKTVVQPGSLDCEAGINACTYDMTGSRLITCETDKTVKFWKEDETATPSSHPISKDWKLQTKPRGRY